MEYVLSVLGTLICNNNYSNTTSVLHNGCLFFCKLHKIRHNYKIIVVLEIVFKRNNFN